MDIEFTDRYGGRPPSWLRGCLGSCQAMGYYPVDNGGPADTWEFEECPKCHGTGRCRWWQTVLRVPRWIVRGVSFLVWSGMTKGLHPPHIRHPWWLGFECAFLADLGLASWQRRAGRA